MQIAIEPYQAAEVAAMQAGAHCLPQSGPPEILKRLEEPLMQSPSLGQAEAPCVHGQERAWTLANGARVQV